MANKLFSWGYNVYGQLGLDDTTNRHTPTQVGSSDWTAIACGYSHSLGISGNKLYVWGRNIYGQLGLDDTTNRHVPTQVGTSDWTAIAGGSSRSLGITNVITFIPQIIMM